MQKHNRKIYKIIYYSKKISFTKLNYDIHNKKLLVIVLALNY